MSYKRRRFPPEIVALAVWLCFRFPLSLRLVEEMLLQRGVTVSYETVRCWGMKFGAEYVSRLRRKTPGRRDVWHLDEVVVTIKGEKRYLWRAVDQDGYVLDEIVQIRRDTKAATRLLARLLRKRGGLPKRIVTDKLGSYAAAQRRSNPLPDGDDARNARRPPGRRGARRAPHACGSSPLATARLVKDGMRRHARQRWHVRSLSAWRARALGRRQTPNLSFRNRF